MDDIKEKLDRIKQLDAEKRDLASDLCSMLGSFNEGLEKAIAYGLVKPAFPVPSGYTRYLRDKFSK